MTGGTRPYYVPVGNEEHVFRAAYRQGLSVLLKGPTGCGKTRFVEAMAYDLERPLVTVACHDDLTTADLVGRFLLEGRRDDVGRRAADPRGARRRDLLPRRDRRSAPGHDGRAASAGGPPASAPHRPARCHARCRARILPRRLLQPRVPERAQGPEGLDAPAHGRHRARLPAARHRREDRGARGRASTRRRPRSLVRLGQAIRRLETAGLREVASTRVLVAAGRLISEGLPVRDAGRAAVAGPLTDDPMVTAGLFEMIDAYLAGASAHVATQLTRPVEVPERSPPRTRRPFRLARRRVGACSASPCSCSSSRPRTTCGAAGASPTGSGTRRCKDILARCGRCSATPQWMTKMQVGTVVMMSLVVILFVVMWRRHPKHPVLLMAIACTAIVWMDPIMNWAPVRGLQPAAVALAGVVAAGLVVADRRAARRVRLRDVLSLAVLSGDVHPAPVAAATAGRRVRLAASARQPGVAHLRDRLRLRRGAWRSSRSAPGCTSIRRSSRSDRCSWASRISSR